MNEESIFAAIIEIPDEEKRCAFLAEKCGDDQKLRQRIEKLVSAHLDNHSLVDRPIDLEHTSETNGSLESVAEGTMIGPYKLLQQVGEGGFGVVFMAEQLEPVRRRVALKVIKPGMDSKEVIARFEAERQALAMMDHPNIAKVLDAGTTELGRPYFVMELVKGIPITEYADDNQLTSTERLKLFQSVCRAIQHAHQKGVIHRDLKPSNVLVTLHDGVPVPKVIDFGVAKALNQQLTEKTLFTRLGQIVGTPQYMSPEQAELSGLDIDTKSDIYSLGVLLYELLAGRPPFDAETLRQAGFDEMRKIIKDKDPQKPSECLKTLDQQTATTVAKARSCPEKNLSRLIPSDLDVIVMRSLEKNRERRFESASEFAQEVERYLCGEPIQSRAPSFAYKVTKSFNKNKTAYIVASTLFMVTAGAAVISFWSYRDAVAGWDVAQQAQNELRAANQKLKDRTEIAEKSLNYLMNMAVGMEQEQLKKIASGTSDYFKENPQIEFEILSKFVVEMTRNGRLSPTACKRQIELAKSLFGLESIEHVEALGNLSRATGNISHFETAYSIVQENKLDPSSNFLSAFGRALFRQKRLDEAEAVLSSALKVFDEKEVVLSVLEIPHLWLAEIKKINGNKKEYEELQKIGLFHLDNQVGVNELDWFRRAIGNFNHQFPVIDEKFPRSNEAVWLGKVAQNKLKDSTNASKSVIHMLFKGIAHAHRKMGRTQQSLESSRVALNWGEGIERSDTRLREMGWCYAGIARAYRDVGEREKSIQNLRKAKDCFEQTDNPWSLTWMDFELGQALSENGDNREGDRFLRSFVAKMNPYVEDRSKSLYGSEAADFSLVFNALTELEQQIPENLQDRILELHEEQKLPISEFWALATVQAEQGQFDDSFKSIETTIKQFDQSSPAADLLILEIARLNKFMNAGRHDLVVKCIKLFVGHKDKTVYFGHPLHALSRLKYGKFLIDNNIALDLAKKLVQEAKVKLKDLPLVSDSYRVEVESLLQKIKLQETAN